MRLAPLHSLPAALFTATVSIASPTPAEAPSSVRTAHARATLVANVTAIAPGDSFRVALRLQPDPGWHVYWSNPGDAGMPPSLDWTLPEGWNAGPLLFPVPERFETPPLASYGYKDDVWYPVNIRVDGGTPAGPRVSLRARAEWLICREECLPEAADLAVTLDVGRTVSHAADAARLEEFAIARLPRPAPPDLDARVEYEDSTVVVSWKARDEFATNDGSDGSREVCFFPAAQGVLVHAAPQTLTAADGRARLVIARDDVLRARPDTLRGVLAFGPPDARRGYELEAIASTAPAAAKPAAGGLLTTLLVGLLSLAGLILLFVLKRPHVSSRGGHAS